MYVSTVNVSSIKSPQRLWKWCNLSIYTAIWSFFIGLYRAAISESGSFLNIWAFQKNGKQLSRSFVNALNPEFANVSVTSKEIVEYLRSTSAKTINTAASSINSKVRQDQKEVFFVNNLYLQHFCQNLWLNNTLFYWSTHIKGSSLIMIIQNSREGSGKISPNLI